MSTKLLALWLGAVAAAAAVLVAVRPAQAQPRQPDTRAFFDICVPFISAGGGAAAWNAALNKLFALGLRVSGSRDTLWASAEVAEGVTIDVSGGTSAPNCEVERFDITPQFRADLARFAKRQRAKVTDYGWTLSMAGRPVDLEVQDFEVTLRFVD